MKANNRGIIYLSGGGDADKTTIIDSLFLKNLPKKEILFIPIAKTADMNGYKKSRIWLTNKLNKLSKDFVNVSMVLDFNKCKNIGNVSAVYIGGGNTYKLLKLMSESGFLPILEKYIKDGGIVYGASAGAVLMGKNISTYIEDKYILENKKHKYTLTKGMALIGNYSIITHFHESGYEKVKEYFKKNNNPVIAIPEGIGLMVKDNCMTVMGDKAVTIFGKSGILKRIKPNTIFIT